MSWFLKAPQATLTQQLAESRAVRQDDGLRAGGRSRGELVGEAPSTSSQLFSSRWGKPHPERSTLLAKDKMAHCLHSSGGKSGPSGHFGFVSTQVKQPHGPSFSVACKSLNIGREKKKRDPKMSTTGMRKWSNPDFFQAPRGEVQLNHHWTEHQQLAPRSQA